MIERERDWKIERERERDTGRQTDRQSRDISERLKKEGYSKSSAMVSQPFLITVKQCFPLETNLLANCGRPKHQN